MTPSEKRAELAQNAYNESEDKLATEKVIYVDEKTFQECLGDKNEHHRNCIEKKGYMRIYHKPFWTENPDGYGRTYNMGIVHVINKDAEVNQRYKIRTLYPEGEINYRVKILRHRLLNISVGPGIGFSLTFTPQRINFDD